MKFMSVLFLAALSVSFGASASKQIYYDKYFEDSERPHNMILNFKPAKAREEISRKDFSVTYEFRTKGDLVVAQVLELSGWEYGHSRDRVKNPETGREEWADLHEVCNASVVAIYSQNEDEWFKVYYKLLNFYASDYSVKQGQAVKPGDYVFLSKGANWESTGDVLPSEDYVKKIGRFYPKITTRYYKNVYTEDPRQARRGSKLFQHVHEECSMPNIAPSSSNKNRL